tara:strand:- start:448 stop:597 length:150 start_codon:yes stop_codon:yes gene_type:complete
MSGRALKALTASERCSEDRIEGDDLRGPGCSLDVLPSLSMRGEDLDLSF